MMQIKFEGLSANKFENKYSNEMRLEKPTKKKCCKSYKKKKKKGKYCKRCPKLLIN